MVKIISFALITISIFQGTVISNIKSSFCQKKTNLKVLITNDSNGSIFIADLSKAVIKEVIVDDSNIGIVPFYINLGEKIEFKAGGIEIPPGSEEVIFLKAPKRLSLSELRFEYVKGVEYPDLERNKEILQVVTSKNQ